MMRTTKGSDEFASRVGEFAQRSKPGVKCYEITALVRIDCGGIHFGRLSL